MAQKILYLLVACSLTVGATVAGNPFPAVDLPSVVPDSVRDRTARELAGVRDRLSWTVSPFRGEFHGLGVAAEAYDLSANGRVVVGADRHESGGSQAFVWSPWTGRAHYDMLPAGISGSTAATSISADGVYVAGNTLTPSGGEAFRWSLAGRELLPALAGNSRDAVAISGNGRVVVGTTKIPGTIQQTANELSLQLVDDVGPGTFPPIVVFPAQRSNAYRWTQQGSIEVLQLPNVFSQSEAVDVSPDGRTILGNATVGLQFIQPGESFRESQPFLWRDGEFTGLGGLPRPGFPKSALDPDAAYIWPQFTQFRTTTANAISADGETVVGNETLITRWLSGLTSSRRTAILWREESGWVDLGILKPDGFFFQSGAELTGVSGDGSLVIGSASISRPCFECGCSTSSCDRYVGEAAFLWDKQRGMRDLVDVLQLDYGLEFTGWDLGEATAISDDGTTIIGNGTNPDGGREAWRAVLHRETPEGDFDFDGDLDHNDYQTLLGNLGMTSDTEAVFYADGDLNADGRVDEHDARTAASLFEPRWAGDFNADGRVDATDYTVWRDHTGSITGIADANGDGFTNAADLAAWRTNFGRLIPQALGLAVPEPTGLLLFMLAITPAYQRRV